MPYSSFLHVLVTRSFREKVGCEGRLVPYSSFSHVLVTKASEKRLVAREGLCLIQAFRMFWSQKLPRKGWLRGKACALFKLFACFSHICFREMIDGERNHP